jgi:hypothetical protein
VNPPIYQPLSSSLEFSSLVRAVPWLYEPALRRIVLDTLSVPGGEMNLNETLNWERAPLSFTFAILSLAAMFAKPCSVSAAAEPPQLTVRTYSRVEDAQWLLDTAAAEAARVLRGIPIRLIWINCAAQAHPVRCESLETPTDLTIRLLSKAPPEASPNALGMAMWSAPGGSAALFYDRALSIRRPGIFLPHILGRALAHEVVHLLLGFGSHSDLGLMRGQWSDDDLRMHSGACLGLSAQILEAIRLGAARRVLIAKTLMASSSGSE